MEQRDLATLSDAERSFEAAFGERLRAILDIDSWAPGFDLVQIYEDLASGVEAAVRHESRVRAALRQAVLPALGQVETAPKGAGVYSVSMDELKRIHQGLLFTGQVEGCDSIQHTLETLPVSVTQIGVSLVSYNGNQGTWTQRLFRRDLNESLGDPTQEALALLERRAGRDDDPHADRQDNLNRLTRRAIREYAERKILLTRSEAIWRLGHGQLAPLELLTQLGGSLDLMIEATKLLEELICGHQKFVFVPRETPGWLLRTLGNALNPLEFAIVNTLSDTLRGTIAREDYTLPTTLDTTVAGKRLTPRQWIQRFRDEIASQVVVGVFKASELAPAQVFYAHADHAQVAGMIALADSALQPHRGFPTLLDLAHHVCDATFGEDSLAAALQLGYTRAGVPFESMGIRWSRGH